MEEIATEKKRKTFTSSAVKKRYNDKTYNQYTVKFRKDEDADLIALIESNKENGISPADTIRILFQK